MKIGRAIHFTNWAGKEHPVLLTTSTSTKSSGSSQHAPDCLPIFFGIHLNQTPQIILLIPWFKIINQQLDAIRALYDVWFRCFPYI